MKIQQTQTLTEMTKIWHTIYHEIVDANGILIFFMFITIWRAITAALNIWNFEGVRECQDDYSWVMDGCVWVD